MPQSIECTYYHCCRGTIDKVAAFNGKKAALRPGQKLLSKDCLNRSDEVHHRSYHETIPVVMYHLHSKTTIHFQRRADANMNFVCLCGRLFLGNWTLYAHLRKYCIRGELPVPPTEPSSAKSVGNMAELISDTIADEGGQECETLPATQDAPHSTSSVAETLQQIQERQHQDREEVRKAVLAMEQRARKDQEMNREALGDMEARIRLSIALSDRECPDNRSDDRLIEQHEQGVGPYRQQDESQQQQEPQKQYDGQEQQPQQGQGGSSKLRLALGSQTPREDRYCQRPAPDEGRCHWMTISQKLLAIHEKLASADIGHDARDYVVDSMMNHMNELLQMAGGNYRRSTDDGHQSTAPCVRGVKRARPADYV